MTKHYRIELVQRALHDLHAYPDVALAEERAIKVHRVWTVAGSHRDIKVHEQSFL